MKFIITDGHGYLKITPQQLKVALDKGFIPTEYSFMNKTSVMLEEDVDVPAYLKIMGIEYNILRKCYQRDINRGCYDRISPELCNYVMNHMFADNLIGV